VFGLKPIYWVRVVSCIVGLSGPCVFNAGAGGSGLNVVVVMNRASLNSCALGNYYRERRQVPAGNVLYIHWAGDNVTWSADEFRTNLLGPLERMISANGLTNQADYVVLSMDIPYQVRNGSVINSTTSALFYGLKPDGGTDWKGVTNSYFASESVFRLTHPTSAPGSSFLATMLTDETLEGAKRLVDQGVDSDGTFPVQPAILAKTSDSLRNRRFPAYDSAIFNTRIYGHYSLLRTNSDSVSGQKALLGFQTGLETFAVAPRTFMPGAMADSLSSYGGMLFVPNGQTTLLEFIHGGAAGSYGTVTEPSADPQKFPAPMNYFYQARGFDLAECYYQSLQAPYEGLLVGEPLASPFAQSALGQWIGVSSNSVLRGIAALGVEFSSRETSHPLGRMDLFIDGLYFQTLTNLSPQPGNKLTVTLNGYRVAYTIPAGASLGDVAAGLAAALNAPGVSNATQVLAQAHGDRVELMSLASNRLGYAFCVLDTSATNPSPRYYTSTYLSAPTAATLSPVGREPSGAYRLHIEAPDTFPYVVQASTNLTDWSALATNHYGGALDLADEDAAVYPRRFYRSVWSSSFAVPKLWLSARSVGRALVAHVEGTAGFPCVIEASGDCANWSPVCTNFSGPPLDFIDSMPAEAPFRFYRALLRVPSAPLPQISQVAGPGAAFPIVRVEGAVRPYILMASADRVHWTPIDTNLNVARITTTTSSTAGDAPLLSTFVTASRSAFLDSEVQGVHSFVVSGSVQSSSWLGVKVTKTNGASVSLSVTNVASSTMTGLAGQLLLRMNSMSDLQGKDGVIGEDLGTGVFGSAVFNVRARSSGPEAAAVQVRVTGSSRLVVSPQGATSLTENLSDIVPRNHLYITAGAASLNVACNLDTTRLEDGFHELTAVAYEGNHVQTQTRISVPVQVENSPLRAEMTLLDIPQNAPVDGLYHVRVTANTNSVRSIRIFSTGGQLGASEQESSTVFELSGEALGPGEHSLHGVVEFWDGRKYRTQPQWFRLTQSP
jgi:uncharacterized protein (TIGR03790 family)